eukprot:TRINITY_DN19368_c0_g1_i1.p1 TRINITY_DN19368_c0_g1~~TRINITY_DN19368_c0_g1_i1.p1  ORF type:complete len:461 (-),score=91.79 TRINITY_DN19368_c0_g1_i1:302-1684(-)
MPLPELHRDQQSLLNATMLAQQQKICEIMSEWMVQHKQIYEAHVAEQQRLIDAIQATQKQTLDRIKCGFAKLQDAEIRSGNSEEQIACQGGGPRGCQQKLLRVSATGGCSCAENDQVFLDSEPAPKQHAAEDASKHPKLCKLSTVDFSKIFTARMHNVEMDEHILKTWRRCSGMHTVEKWVKNFRKHPAGWAALLTIHGIPEVTGRLRSKVDNYAIYSALFLSMSMPMLMAPPETLLQEPISQDWWEWQLPVEVRARMYAYALFAGVSLHMVCILLGMAFNNALNEAARDSDVFRMFSSGKGFLATVKCQQTFRFGCAADMLALVIAASCYISVLEMILTSAICAVIGGRVVWPTENLLMKSVSIVKYWRTELGGMPHEDDPFDISTPMSCFDERCEANCELFKQGEGAFCGDGSEVFRLWEKLRVKAKVTNPTGATDPDSGDAAYSSSTGVSSSMAALF